MGIPYSKQINAAFDQVTPLVAAGFEVLQTTKNISILLAVIQVLTVILLSLILFALFLLLISVNPTLETETAELVTPIVRWLAHALTSSLRHSYLIFNLAIATAALASIAFLYYISATSANVQLGDEGDADSGPEDKSETAHAES